MTTVTGKKEVDGLGAEFSEIRADDSRLTDNSEGPSRHLLEDSLYLARISPHSALSLLGQM